MSDSNLTIDDLNALPERMRAHAAAKAVGLTSKEFLAAMAGIGVEVKSAQSSVTREGLLTWFAGRDKATTAAASVVEPTQSAPAAAEEAAPPAKKTARKAPAKKAAATEVPAKKAAATKAPAKKAAATRAPAKNATATQAPAEETPAGEAPAEKTAAKATEPAAKKAPAKKAPTTKAPAKEAPATNAPAKEAPVRRPLPEIAIVTGEVGAADTGNRRRRSTATPSFSPLFLSPDDVVGESGGRGNRRGGSGQTGGSQPANTQTTRSDEVASTEDALAVDDTDITTDGETDDNTGNGEGGNRRRRRGRRGRGRGRGESFDGENSENDSDDEDSDESETNPGRDNAANPGGDSADADTTNSDHANSSDDHDDSDEDDSDDGSDGSNGSPSGSRRRRRRRRRSGGGSGTDDAQNADASNSDSQAANDDPPNTEIHEREPRRQSGRGQQSSGTSSDEVQGISGSTRLEAKRQRRRDGREAGRRRQPILSESEFLARREAVDRVMVVREKSRADGHGIMTQVGVLEDKVLVEHFVTTESARSMVGNVYLGRVQNVLPSMEAAFVDIGRGRNGVLYAGEVNWEAAGLGGKARRIEQALKSGDMVLVQVTKDPIGQKGARLSTQISLAGRFLVYVPDGNSTGISRKLPDTERRRLKAILKDVVPEGSGVIIRTAAEGVSEEEIGRDVERLSAQWTQISEAADKRKSSGAGTPTALYEEPDLLVKVVRDLFNEDFSKLVIQGETSWNTVHDYVSRVAPEMAERLERYENPDIDVFSTYRVDEQLAKALDRKVWLPSGGSLVIDRTEAMTVVDVNTGKYTGSGGNLEETVTKNNLEAAEEIVRQLRLRDIGGMVIVDFIDMVLEGNRDLVLRRLTEALGRDRTRHQVSEVTSLGLVQLTRKKLGTGLVEAFSTPCEHCQGRGLLVHADPVHTESHNADESGARKGRRRGGKTSGGSGHDEAPKQPAPRKDGPAPAAHPAALAIGHHDEHGEPDKAKSVDAQSSADNRAATHHAADNAADNAAGQVVKADAVAAEPVKADAVKSEPVKADRAQAEPAVAEIVTPEITVADAAQKSSSSSEQSGGAGPSGQSEEPGTRTRRRRRATRGLPGESAAHAPSSPEGATTGAGAAVPEPEAAHAAAESKSAVDPQSEENKSTAGGRRPRRRSTRREARAAASVAAPAQEAVQVVEASVEAATLAEAPTTVVVEPRTRPARRRATRSTTAPSGDGN